MPKRPAMLLIENVVGLLTANKGKNYEKLHHSLLNLGYKSGAILLDAARFVPQSRPRVFVIAVKRDVAVPQELQDSGPNWLHNKAVSRLGRVLPEWIWWFAEMPPKRHIQLVDIIDFNLPYDKDHVLGLLSPRHKKIINCSGDIVATGYRRTRNGKQCLELRFDGVAGCLRTPEGGSSKQFLVVKRNGKLRARVMSPREAARLMGAPDSFVLPEKDNDGYKAMGDAVVIPVASFVGSSFLTKLAEVIYRG
jgi:DNA (cytosine-5)-methyltransferase 1